MVRVMKFFAYSVFFVMMLIYFMPKISFYYLLEDTLLKSDVVISKEELVENGFSLDISNANVFVKSIDTAKIKSINVKVFAFYNLVILQDITFSKSMKSFVPLHVESVNVKYSILNPQLISINGVGDFGEFEAKYSLSDGVIILRLKPSKLMLDKYRATLDSLKKSENGEYIYEKNI